MDVERAADLYAQGWTLRQIGAELGVHWSTVGQQLQRAGIAMRRGVGELLCGPWVFESDQWRRRGQSSNYGVSATAPIRRAIALAPAPSTALWSVVGAVRTAWKAIER